MKAAKWARVSTSEQETDNQVQQIQDWAGPRGLEVVQVYRVQEPALPRHPPEGVDPAL